MHHAEAEEAQHHELASALADDADKADEDDDVADEVQVNESGRGRGC